MTNVPGGGGLNHTRELSAERCNAQERTNPPFKERTNPPFKHTMIALLLQPDFIFCLLTISRAAEDLEKTPEDMTIFPFSVADNTEGGLPLLINVGGSSLGTPFPRLWDVSLGLLPPPPPPPLSIHSTSCPKCKRMLTQCKIAGRLLPSRSKQNAIQASINGSSSLS